jgi:membrane-associated protein
MLDVTHIIQSGGLPLLGLFLFAEVGLFLGFFLPGDTLLIAAGVYAKQGKLSIASVILVAGIAAIAGDSTSYFIGRKLGRRVFRKDDSILFRKDHIMKAENFYERHGTKTVLIAHFLPVIRTFSPLLAGVGKMHYPKFLSLDATGDIAWALIISLAGYYVGSRIPNIDHYILIAVGAVVIISLAPTLYQLTRVIVKHRQRQSSAGKTDQDDKRH